MERPRWIPTPEQRALTQIRRQMAQWHVSQWYWSVGPDRWASVVWRFRDTIYGFSSVAVAGAPADTALRQCARLIRQLQTDAAQRGVAWTTLAPRWVDANPIAPVRPSIPECFRTLGFVTVPTTQAAVKRRYRILAKTMHPDAGGDAAAFRALTEAAAAADAWMIAHASTVHIPSN